MQEKEVFLRLPPERRFDMEVVAQVLPFRVNQYVLDELVDWADPESDPIFKLVFPHRDMLPPHDFDAMAALLKAGAPPAAIKALAEKIRLRLNPHPAEQSTLNVPSLDGMAIAGVQHKYRETVLFFPSQGQTCHSYCSFCFRWPQFVGKQHRFASPHAERLYSYLSEHKEVSDLLVTGGDPLVMRTSKLAEHLSPLLDEPGLEHVSTVRIGTKSLTFWPQRFVTDDDADDLLRLFERLANAGKHVAIMAHINHWREMESPIFAEAVRRIRDAGAVVRSQAPLLAGINDTPEVWSTMWKQQVRSGIVPYYMFVERDTGAKEYFEVPLAKAHAVYSEAVGSVSGLARTARGPSMSCGPGKVEISGIAEVAGEKVFVLNFVQARDPRWIKRPFFARFDAQATWFDGLKPAFGEDTFFFSEQYADMLRSAKSQGLSP
ncbi:MAG: lysine 2,3-aminomutase [Pseudomonadota bacterium]|nr:lysine 2,3-aminomutase [Pseudomonadota bacterium]